MLLPTLFPGSLTRPGPKHSTSISSSSGVAVPLSVDEKEVALVPNPVPDLAVRVLPGPHVDTAPTVLSEKIQALLPPTLQVVNPFLSPVTVQLKVKVSPGQVGGAAVSCPATSPERNKRYIPVECTKETETEEGKDMQIAWFIHNGLQIFSSLLRFPI